jgi:hypothetical protein
VAGALQVAPHSVERWIKHRGWHHNGEKWVEPAVETESA